MLIGTLDVEVKREGQQPRLVVRGQLYGLESPVTIADLERLARFSTVEAAKLREEVSADG